MTFFSSWKIVVPVTMLVGILWFVLPANHSVYYFTKSPYLDEEGQYSVLVIRQDSVLDSGGLMDRPMTTKRSCDYWRAAWRVNDLHKGSPNPPVKIFSLGHFREDRDRNHQGPTETEGVDLSLAYFTGTTQCLSWQNGAMSSVTLPLSPIPQFRARIPDEYGTTAMIMSRSHQQAFVWLPVPAILETQTLQPVKTLPATETFEKFRSLARSNDVSRWIYTRLTEDLRFLVAIPDKASDSPQDFNRNKAWCYDLQNDIFAELRLHYGTITHIDDVESIDGRLQFMVSNQNHKLAILDEASAVLGDLASVDSTVQRIWDWRRHRVFTLKEQSFDVDAELHDLELFELDYAVHVQKYFVLKAAELKAL